MVLLDEASDWFLALDCVTAELVAAAIDLLAQHGPALGRPVVDRIESSTQRNLKELRPGSTGRTEVRILFAFDPERKAVLLVAGDKAGRWKDRHRTNIPLAEARCKGWLRGDRQRRRDMARSWKAVREDAVNSGLVSEERVGHQKKKLTGAVQAQRLAEIRKAHALSQKTLAERMKVSQARVSKIEHGTLGRTELGTLESYVEALGGKLRIVADFDDESIALH